MKLGGQPKTLEEEIAELRMKATRWRKNWPR